MSMQKILVLDVPADSGGALTVLKEYYERLKQDGDNRYLFCLGVAELPPTDTVRVLRFPWVKRSWLHRLWFDQITVKRLIRREKPDRILSLQNVTVPGAPCPQTLYLHQSLPFCGIRFSLWRQPKFWVYQHLISRRIIRSVRRADRVILQTKWMRDAVCQKAGISPDKVTLETPEVGAVTAQFDKSAWRRGFFYPASPLVYKNHERILQAMERLADRGIRDYEVTFTLTADQLPCLSRYPRAAERLRLPGQMPREQVMETYASTVLLFPSYIETFGLPLLEARQTGAPVLASDCPFSREILEGYASARFFDPFSPDELADRMSEILEEGL